MTAPTITTEAPLTPAQIAEFEERGYLTIPGVFLSDEVAAMRRAADRLLEMTLNSALATGIWNPRLDLTQKDGLVDVRKLQPINDASEILRLASEDERLIAPMRQIMGDEPTLMEEKLNYKQVISCDALLEKFPVRSGDDRFPLHHDWGYYRQQGYPTSTMSSAICIDACTHDNGPLRVIPGTHRRDDWPLMDPDAASGNGVVADGLFAEEDRVDCVAPEGSVLLFHSLLLHDSKPNTTGRPRRLMIYSHYPSAYGMKEDERNGPGRAAARLLEDTYRQMLARGDYQDRWEAE